MAKQVKGAVGPFRPTATTFEKGKDRPIEVTLYPEYIEIRAFGIPDRYRIGFGAGRSEGRHEAPKRIYHPGNPALFVVDMSRGSRNHRGRGTGEDHSVDAPTERRELGLSAAWAGTMGANHGCLAIVLNECQSAHALQVETFRPAGRSRDRPAGLSIELARARARER